MSAISEINKVWIQKFPGSQLPAAWEEDVKTNLSKHKQRVVELQEELEQERVYVQFLESLLEEVEKRKEDPSLGVSGENKNGGPSTQEMDDVIKDTLERRSLVAQFTATADASTEPIASEDDTSLAEGVDSSKEPESRNSKIHRGNSVKPTAQRTGRDTPEQDLSSDDQLDDNKDHFVTVIEVNGFDKKQASASGPSTAAKLSNEDVKRLKKVPPRPPPKSFKRPDASFSKEPRPFPSSTDSSSSSSAVELEAKQSSPENSRSKPDRPVIFDSRKNSTGNGSESNYIGGSGNSKSQSHPVESGFAASGSVFSKSQNKVAAPSKRFEGSKLPLPNPQNDLDERAEKAQRSPSFSESQGYANAHPYQQQHLPSERDNPNVRSKILDLVNKMESSHKPMAPAKNIEQLTPKRSFRKTFQGPKYHAVPADPVVSDYVDPCDAEFDLNNDQIYDSPPPEDDPTQPETGQRGSKPNTLDIPHGGNNHGGPVELENEPMYDTVAPDPDLEDDYVLLMEEGNQNGSSTSSLNKRDASLGSCHNDNGPSNNDLATIKSQTSVVSGHSITTTTSSGTTSDTEGLTGSPLPHDHSSSGDLSQKNSRANYVNIDYFLSKPNRKDSQASGESEEDEPPLLRAISIDQDSEVNGESPDSAVYIDSGVYGSSADSNSAFGSSTPPMSRDAKSETATMTAAEQEKYALFRFLLANIAESESAYVDVLNVMIHYMKALKATLATSKPVLSQDEFNIIFYKIPELFELHQKFLAGLQQKSSVKLSVGKHFQNLAHDIGVYGAFLQNYSRAVDTVRKCSQNNSDFAEIAKNIRLRSLNNQAVSLETLLYSPVSRVQKNIEIIQDLLKCLPVTHPDHVALKSALREFQSFLSEFKMIQPEQLFQGQDRNPRHLVKNSFIVELSEGHRKLRHIFLFNDVLVCAKYKASGKCDKFTFELKWYIPVAECTVVEESTEPRESAPVNLVALRSQASTVRDQIKRQSSRDDPKKAKAEKQRKKLAELEAQLVLASPNLVFKVKAGTGRGYTFFLSSEYERSQWVDAIDALKASQPSAAAQLGMHELQSWLTSCRKHLKTNMGSYLLRSGRDENLLVGDLYILIEQLKGIQRAADLYICLEVDSYGHFFRKAKTKMICESTSPCWNQDFTIELEGAQNLRILLYEDHQRQGTLIRAKTTIELNRTWLTGTMTERKIDLQDYVLTMFTKFTPSEMTIRRVPTAKPSGLFGAKITQVCKREKRQVPFILTSCLREVERRGINEVGLYRVSGSTSDVSRLKKAFETNSYEAEQLLKEVDIHSVTGTLKLYMRELPEALFTDELYPRFFEAFNQQDQEAKKRTLLQLFSTLPPINQHIIMSLLDHMVRVNKHENHNKMSLHNIATVFGPTLLRPGARSEGSGNTDLLAAGTVDVMAQAGILYFFLTRRASGEPMQLVQQSGH